MENSESSKAANVETQNDSTPRSLHTPGPWGIEWTTERAWIGPMRGYDDKIQRIVTSTEREGLTAESLAEKDANARLIAAAPELLQACKDAAAVIFNHIPVDIPVCVPGIARTLRGVIAKAEGAQSDPNGNENQPVAPSSSKSVSVFNQGRAQ